MERMQRSLKEMDRYTLADFARMPALQGLVEIGGIG